MANHRSKQPVNGFTGLLSPQKTAPNVPSGEAPDSAFAGLREQIEARLAKTAKQVHTKKEPKAKSLNNAPDKREIENGPLVQGRAISKGKKRDRNGNILGQPTNSRTEEKTPKDAQEGVDNQRALEEEMRDLGGTADDLELMRNAESESELDGAEDNAESAIDVRRRGKTGDSMDKGIQNILKEIALVQGKAGPSADGSNEFSDSEEEDAGADQEILPAPTALPTAPVSTSKPGRKPASNLKCELRPDWFNASYLNQADSTKQPQYTLSNTSLSQLRNYALDLLETENQAYTKTQQHSSSQSFYNTVIASGTLSDKISALTLAVQESPIHNVKALELLIGLAKKRSRAQAVDVLRALKDLFAQGSLLPSDRRLYTFGTQPGLVVAFAKLKNWSLGDELPRVIGVEHLISWCYEDWLKEQYFEILKTLEVWCNDEIEFSKSRAVNYVFELLKEKPEQESNLLRLLINKLGDPIKKIASQTSYLLMQLLGAHPAMKEIVISAIEADFLFRPGQSMHGKYYAIVTLNQTALSSQEEKIAVKLLDIYFGLFSSLLKSADSNDTHTTNGKSTTRGERRNKKIKGPEPETKETELREKFIAAILTGVNRAYPYSDTDGRNLSAHLETLFKITHSSNFNTSIQAMMLIQQMSSSHQASSDRFYRTLYESLLDARLVSSSKQQLYLNLLHRSLKADLNLKRIKAFMKRILQILSLHDASFVCAAFFLLKDLESTFPALTGLVDQSEEHEEEDEVFKDVDDDESATLDQAQTERLQKLEAKDSAKDKTYDGRKRDPEHSHADNSCAWELLPYLAHYHPAVMVSAGNLVRHSKMPGKPDLSLHTLIHFLDRFVYKNPKLASTNLRGSSIMQPMANSETQSILIGSRTTVPGMPVNTDHFRNQNDEKVAAEDVFFHRYFSSLGKDGVKHKTSNADMRSEGSSIGDGNEDAVWKAMINSAPDLEGVVASDQDLSMSDLESEFDDTMEDSEGESGGNADANADEVEGVPIFDETDDDTADLIEQDDTSDEEDEPSAVEPSWKKTPPGTKSKSSQAREQRKQLKALPVFASAADYATMLNEDDDGDLG